MRADYRRVRVLQVAAVGWLAVRPAGHEPVPAAAAPAGAVVQSQYHPASMAGQVGLASGAAYGATRPRWRRRPVLAAEFSPSGVRVNAVGGGPVLTAGAAPDRIEALGATVGVAAAVARALWRQVHQTRAMISHYRRRGDPLPLDLGM